MSAPITDLTSSIIAIGPVNLYNKHRCQFTSADNFESGAVLMYRLGLGFVTEMAVGVWIVQITDVLHTLSQGRQRHGVHLVSVAFNYIISQEVSLYH